MRPLPNPGSCPGTYRTGEAPAVGDIVDGHSDGISLARVYAIEPDGDTLSVHPLDRVPGWSEEAWSKLPPSTWLACCCCLVRRDPAWRPPVRDAATRPEDVPCDSLIHCTVHGNLHTPPGWPRVGS